MRAGLRAIFVLSVATVVAVVLGVAYARDRTICQAASLGLVALVFFLWAVSKDMATGDLSDLGVVSFGAVLVAAASTITYKYNDFSPEVKLDRARRAWLHLGLACALVTANYVWVYVDKPLLPETFKLYLAVGATWWGSATVWTVTVLRGYARSLATSDHDFEEEALMNASAQGRFRVLLAS
jgi:hypothetical protein